MRYLKTTVFLLSFITFYLNNVKADIGAEFKNRILNSEYSYKYPFQERKNDIGIYFDFDWDKKNKEIIIKREDKNFPVIRYSLFNKNKIKKGLSVFKYDDNDLSKLSDEKIIELFRQNKEARILLSNNETLNLKPNIYDYNDIKLANFDLEFINNIDTNKGLLEISFEAAFINQRPELNKFARDLLTDDPISIDTTFGYYPILTPEFKEYKYDIDIRKGIKSADVKDLPVSFTYDNNEVRTIRFESGIGQFRQQFDFKKFPFDNQKLIIPIISGATNTSNPENAWPKTGYGAVHFITPDKGAYLGLENYLNNISENYLKEWQVKSVDIQSEEIVKENYYNKFLKNDKKYIIVGMSSALTGLSEKKFEDSYNKIVSDLKEFFPNAQFIADKPIHPWNKKTKAKRTSFKINPRDKFYAISAVYLNFPEDETRFVDNVGVTINTDEYNIYLNAIE